MKQRRVVVTGIGALTPIGNNVAEFSKALMAGTSGSAPITKFDTTHFKTKFACELKGFDPLNFMDKKEARKLDPFCHYALVAAEEAMTDAAIDLEKINRNKAGVIWASGMGGLLTFQEDVMEYVAQNKVPRFNPFFITKIITDISSGHISMKYGLKGLNYNTVSACASSTHALIDAFNYIKWGKANLIVAGGSEAAITDAGIGGFSVMKALSTRNECPEQASRPFDKDRDGFVMGEGAAVLILEELEHALSRGAKIYAEMIGGGMSADAYHLTATHPEGDGAYRSMMDTLEDASITADQVDYLNPHATSTPLGDTSEMKAVARLFENTLDKLAISATKSQIGHLLGAAGAIEALICLLAIKEGKVPPTINVENVDPEIDPRLQLVIGKAIEKDIKVAMSNTFGFGGHNATVLMKKFENA